MPRIYSPTAQATIPPTSRLHVYLPLACPHFRYFGFLFILGGFSAFALIYLRCLPPSSSSYCNSTPGILSKFLTSPFIENSSEQHSYFTEGNCITAADSAVITSFHL
ncbi:hypothetical protein ARMSODRAFT_1084755 [Armillaria solidipes]|uniref:Uncharacterized protein n=1 Tax=Armillaria solidipes TaxID=1076256 RepID=A0A2H3C2B3_9AGAR|nr:hypothetical protein ARMSODRAFT_1084755 [Armillaria solidipes]